MWYPPSLPPLPVLNINLVALFSTKHPTGTQVRGCVLSSPSEELLLCVCAQPQPQHITAWPSSDAHRLTPLGAALKEASWEAEVEKGAETMAKGLGYKKAHFDPRPAAKCAAGFECRASSRSPQPTQPGQPQPPALHSHTAAKLASEIWTEKCYVIIT